MASAHCWSIGSDCTNKHIQKENTQRPQEALVMFYICESPTETKVILFIDGGDIHVYTIHMILYSHDFKFYKNRELFPLGFYLYINIHKLDWSSYILLISIILNHVALLYTQNSLGYIDVLILRKIHLFFDEIPLFMYIFWPLPAFMFK